MELLVNAGSDINAVAHRYMGRTPLQAAAENGNHDVVEMLFHQGDFRRFEGMPVADVSLCSSLSRRQAQRPGVKESSKSSKILAHLPLIDSVGTDVNGAIAHHFCRTAL